MKDDQFISAFAFETGKKIEKLITERTNNIEERNQELESKILEWYSDTGDEQFANYFNIKTEKHERIF
jgi:hypothetical protein